MVATIHQFRFSLIWAIPCLEPAAGTENPFAERSDFESLFDRVQRRPSVDGFSAPWPLQGAYAHRFWSYYLQVTDPALADGQLAWSKAVPLRESKASFKAKPADDALSMRVEQFCYPFGVAMVLTFDGNGPLTGQQWVEAVIGASSGKVSVASDAADRQMPLLALVNKAMTTTCQRYFGLSALALPEPFTIATVIRGDGADEDHAPDEGGDLHRWLFGAASRRATFMHANLDDVPLADCLLQARKGAAPGDVVFSTPHGRAIWIPSAFLHPKPASPGEKPVTSLSCYHRNQMFAALTSESLCAFARALVDRISKNPTLPTRLDDLGRNATVALRNLELGENTYRSMSVRRQIKDSGSSPRIATLQKRYGV